MKVLIVLTDTFPYGSGETFIENEAHYWDLFDKSIVVPLCKKSDMKNIRTCQNAKFDVWEVDNRLSLITKIYESIKALFSVIAFHEVFAIHRKSNNKAASFKQLLSLSVNSEVLSNRLYQSIKSHSNEDDEIYLYAYWAYMPAAVAAKIKKRIAVEKFVIRAHGYDLYEERSNGYLPLRDTIFSVADKIVPISYQGEKYLSERYPVYADRIQCQHLGTKDNGVQHHTKESSKFRIVSCSNCISLKRIELIIEALSKLENGSCYEWHHFGDGELLEKLKKMAKDLIHNGVSWKFEGRKTNTELMEIYRESYFDVFLNVSETEGIPVSIMEAMSFGIPTIATNVGGTAELVIDDLNGCLLTANPSADDVRNAVTKVATMPKNEYETMRKNARVFWSENYNAEINYPAFVASMKGDS